MPALTTSPPFASNSVETRDDLQNLLTGLLDALAPHTSPGCALIHLGHTATHYDEIAAQLEGFSRPIWGLASLLAGGGSYAGTARWVRGFASGTDPEGEEFWGEMRDKDQRMVECSAIGFAIAVAKEQLWDPLPEDKKTNFENWLGGMNDKQMPNTNWLWFRVFANLGLLRAGSKRFDAARMKADMDHLDTFYVGDGWSRDGPETVCQFDYYSSSFAIQFAQLVYSKLMQADDPDRCEEYRQRARRFALDFVHYFDEEGRAIPFGRSMCYRFAQSSFWGALAFADVELPAPLTWGVVKGLQLRNIRYWTRVPGAFHPDGTLTLGFAYPNHNMLENYNSPGSVYWCCKSFVALAVPPSHPFWAAKEEPYPTSLTQANLSSLTLEKPLHIASHLAHHTLILSSGQRCSYALKQSAAKYGKFAYSAAFGYSVPVGTGSLPEAGADSTLAICDLSVDSALQARVEGLEGSDGMNEVWRARRVTLDARIEKSADGERAWLRSSWKPFVDTEVETILVPPHPATPAWHLRIHHIHSSRAVRLAEGGFAIYGQRRDGRHLDLVEDVLTLGGGYGMYEKGGEALASSRAGVSGLVALESGAVLLRRGTNIRLDANSNLVEARAVLPTLLWDVIPPSEGEKVDAWVVTAVFAIPAVKGEEDAKGEWLDEWKTIPEVPREILALIK